MAVRACRQRVGGLLLARLRGCGERIPDDAMRELNAFADHVAAANRVRIRRILPVLHALQAEGVRCLLLKGAALLATVYDDISMRPMVDVDILIDGENVHRADDALRQLGWIAGPDLVRGDFYPRFHYEREYVTCDEPKVRVDLHVRPFRPLQYESTIPAGAFFDSAAPASLAGQKIQMPNAETMFIHLAAHAALHGARELRWLYDIHAWLQHRDDTLDVNAIVDRCRAWRLTLPVRFALGRAVDAFGPVGQASELLAALPDNAGVIDRIVLWQAPHGDERHAIDVAVNAIAMHGWRKRLTYLTAVALPDASHLRQIYPHRHTGWIAAAHALRVGKLLTAPFSRRDVA